MRKNPADDWSAFDLGIFIETEEQRSGSEWTEMEEGSDRRSLGRVILHTSEIRMRK